MTKTLNTGRYGAAAISNLYEVKGMFGANKNSVGERMMDLNNNREGRQAAIDGRQISDQNLITHADSSQQSAYQNELDYRDGGAGNSASVTGSSVSFTYGNSQISATSTGQDSFDVSVTTSRTGSRIEQTKSYSCSGSGEDMKCN